MFDLGMVSKFRWSGVPNSHRGVSSLVPRPPRLYSLCVLNILVARLLAFEADLEFVGGFMFLLSPPPSTG